MSILKVRALTDLNGDALQGSDVPAGAIAWFPANNIPEGFLKANGANVSRTTYAALFAVLGTAYGAGDGSTTFTLPDYRGEFFRGWDNGRGVDSGRSINTSQGQEIASHNHRIRLGSVENGGGRDCGCYPQIDNSNYCGACGEGCVSWSGGNETRPKNYAMLAIIKY